MSPDTESSSRPGRTLGCVVLPLALVVGGFFAVLLIVFLDSGSDTGMMVLEQREAYGRGTVEYIGERNFYLVRLGDGSFLALSDLDAANRASTQRRCRAAPIPTSDPALPGLLDRYRARLSPAATQSTLLFREDCNGAIYDLTGARLDQDGPNLDRYPVSIRKDGKVGVDLARRQCTRRTAEAASAEVACS